MLTRQQAEENFARAKKDLEHFLWEDVKNDLKSQGISAVRGARVVAEAYETRIEFDAALLPKAWSWINGFSVSPQLTNAEVPIDKFFQNFSLDDASRVIRESFPEIDVPSWGWRWAHSDTVRFCVAAYDAGKICAEVNSCEVVKFSNSLAPRGNRDWNVEFLGILPVSKNDVATEEGDVVYDVGHSWLRINPEKSADVGTLIHKVDGLNETANRHTRNYLKLRRG